MVIMDDEKLNQLLEDFYLINPMFRRLLIHHKMNFKGKKMPPSNYRVLKILRNCGAIPMSEIGRKVYISRPNMTSLIDKLVDEGLAERAPDDNDRRVINIAITKKGEESLWKWSRKHNQKMRDKLSVLSDEDLEKLYESLENIKTILNKLAEK